jgi:hypothetical protein
LVAVVVVLVEPTVLVLVTAVAVVDNQVELE